MNNKLEEYMKNGRAKEEAERLIQEDAEGLEPIYLPQPDGSRVSRWAWALREFIHALMEINTTDKQNHDLHVPIIHDPTEPTELEIQEQRQREADK